MDEKPELTDELVLEHYGIRGMKWGVRRARGANGLVRRGPKPPPSKDYQRARSAKKKARRGGTKALSNDELQDLVRRMDLEIQYAKKVPRTANQVAVKFVTDTAGQFARQQAQQFINDQGARVIKKAMGG